MSELGVRRVSHYTVLPDDDWRLLRRDAQPSQQGLGRLVLFEVDEPVGQAITGGDFAQPAGVGQEAGSDDPEACPELDQQERRSR